MILKPLIVEAAANYFKQDITWKLLMDNLARGKEFLHGHVWVDSILHPESVRKIVEGYLETHGLHLVRKAFVRAGASGGWHPKPEIRSQLPGFVTIENIQPKETTHFEVFMRYSQEHVIAATPPSVTFGNTPVDLWDEDYKKTSYAKLDFKTTLTAEEEKDLIAFYNSPVWEELCHFVYDEKGTHAHLVFETSIHPDIIQEYAVKAIEARGWEFSRGVHFGGLARHLGHGMLMLSIKDPELYMELEWWLVPDVSIKPLPEPITEKVIPADLAPAMAGIEYIEVDDEAVQEIIELCKHK